MKNGRSKATVKEDPIEEDASSAVENDNAVEPEEEDDFLVSDGEEEKAASKNAQLALTHIIDVDVEGGWKVGAP